MVSKYHSFFLFGVLWVCKKLEKEGGKRKRDRTGVWRSFGFEIGVVGAKESRKARNKAKESKELRNEGLLSVDLFYLIN